MLTKKVSFDPEVLDALRLKTTWAEDGLSCKIEPLDKKLYQKVAKALKIMGGKWVGGRTQATVFEADPRPQVEGFLQNGSLTVERDGFFQTPSKVVLEDLLPLADIHGKNVRILEPEAGMGAIASQINLHCVGKGVRFSLDVCEKNEKRAAFLKGCGLNLVAHDFLKYEPEELYDYIVMNPPFEEGQDCVHVMHAFNMLKPGGTLVAIMGANQEYRENGKYKIFKEWLAGKHPHTKKLPKDAFKDSGTMFGATIIVLYQPEKGSKASLEKIAKGNPNKQATLAAQRVLAKREARKAGIQPITQQPTEDLNLKGTGKTTKARYGTANEIDNPEPKVVKKHGKTKKPEPELVVKYINAEGRPVLGTPEPLPDPHAENLGLSEDVVDDMNAWFRWYASMPFYFKDDAERDARVRQDWAAQGANDKSIQLVEVDIKNLYGEVVGQEMVYQRFEKKQKKV